MRKVALALVFGSLALGVAQPGDALAQVKCGDTLNEDVTLTDTDPIVNQTCKGTGLVLGNVDDKFGITLDCGGRTIRGNGTGKGLVTGPGVEGVTITNCVIDGFATGIYLKDPGFHSIERTVVMNSTEHGILVETDENFISQTVSQKNGGWGFSIHGKFNELSDANVALDNRKGGFLVRGRENFLDTNFAIRNGGNGFDVEGRAVGVSFNLAVANTGTGILAGGGELGDEGSLSDNTAIANSGDGIVANKRYFDDGANRGVANGGVNCVIGGVVCSE